MGLPRVPAFDKLAQRPTAIRSRMLHSERRRSRVSATLHPLQDRQSPSTCGGVW